MTRGRSVRRADLLPKVDANASATYQRIAENFSSTKLPQTIHQYNIGLGVSSYELDLFGRVQSLKGQALEQYLATEQAQRSIQISLVSQVATGWLALAADRERLQLARDTLANQQESYKLTRSRFEAGVSSALVVNQAQTTVDAARVDIARYTTLVAQDENALDQLVGSKVPAELLPQALSESLTSLRDITPGLPSDVLLKRPDILQAEGELKGANANIGAARAAFFPKITRVQHDHIAGTYPGSEKHPLAPAAESITWIDPRAAEHLPGALRGERAGAQRDPRSVHAHRLEHHVLRGARGGGARLTAQETWRPASVWASERAH